MKDDKWVDAIEERIESKDNQQEHTQVEEREVPTETSNSDSIVDSGEIQAKINKPKKKAKKGENHEQS